MREAVYDYFQAELKNKNKGAQVNSKHQDMHQLRQLVIENLLALCGATMKSPETIILSSILHTVVGGILTNREAELMVVLKPFLEESVSEITELVNNAFEEGFDLSELFEETDPDKDFFDNATIIQ